MNACTVCGATRQSHTFTLTPMLHGHQVCDPCLSRLTDWPRRCDGCGIEETETSGGLTHAPGGLWLCGDCYHYPLTASMEVG